MFKIATWNVNSLRVRLPHVLEWMADKKPDVLALQETKLPDPDFPIDAIKEAGYHVVFSGQRTYNGVAVLSRHEMKDPILDFPTLDDHQRRVLAVTVNDIRILNLYVPNGESVGSEKYAYKLNWLKQLDLFLQHEKNKYHKRIVLGDFNIAPADIDVHDPKQWEGSVLCSDLERQAFKMILNHGFKDCLRELHPDEKIYSWWDYRMNAFKRKMGLRIDHVLASDALFKECKECMVDPVPRMWERPSDHAPVMAVF